MSRIRAVFFDAGHTLLHPHPDLGSVYVETTEALGARVPAEAFREAFRPAFAESVARHRATPHASDAQDRAMWREITAGIHGAIPALGAVPFERWFEALYVRFGAPSTWRLYGDVEASLAALRARGLRLAVVSNWDTRLRGIAEGLGLAAQVDAVVISAEAGVRKPDPGIFRIALERAGVGADEALHVGDLAEEDVEGARRAGLRAVLIERTPGRGAPPGVPLIRGLAELEALL